MTFYILVVFLMRPDYKDSIKINTQMFQFTELSKCKKFKKIFDQTPRKDNYQLHVFCEKVKLKRREK